MRLINADELKNALSHYQIKDNIFIDEIEMYIDDTQKDIIGYIYNFIFVHTFTP